MIKKEIEGSKVIIFNSISEVVQFNRDTERTNFYQSYHTSDETGSGRYSFTKTNSYEEAEDLLLHGWDSMAERLTKKIGNVKCQNGYKNKTVYGVQGYQACVPRYLQGIPDNMVSSKRITTKQKVLNIVKDFGYSGATSAETIENESIKVLKAVNELELTGYRVNLSITFVSRCRGGYRSVVVKIKNASQRMNIKQMAFPLVHPSMFRRIVFGLIERLPETECFGYGYGTCTEYNETKHLFKGDYFIPHIVSETEITDIEKYKIN